MSDDRPESTTAMVPTGRSSPHRINATVRKVTEEMGDQAPVMEIRGDNDMMGKMGLIMAALEANDIPTSIPMISRQSKRKDPSEVQERAMNAAEAKRERRRQKRLRERQRQEPELASRIKSWLL